MKLLQELTESHGHDWDMGKMIKGAKDAHERRAMRATIDSIVASFKEKEIDKATAIKYLSNKELSDEELKKAITRLTESQITEGDKEIVTKVRIVIDTTNDAFNVPEEEISRILTKAAHEAKRNLENKSLLDANGNKVGSMTFEFSKG